MTKIVQIAGGESTTEDFYIGPERELRADTSNDELRLHDGTKVGGFRFLNMDQNDARYQGRSVELDGFSFGAQAKGILVRVSPSNYALRAIDVNTGQLTITNPRGTAGNIILGFAGTITTDHTFAGSISFLEAINGLGGFVGDLTGDVAGNVTGNVVGNVTGNLTGNANGNHTGSFTGDVDVRGATLLLDDGQINPSKIADLVAFIKDNAEELGVIKMWSGSIESIPARWALCDGTNGTPDLTDKFIVGAGNSFAPAVTGGSNTHVHTGTTEAEAGHTHTLTIATHALTEAEMPSHKHANGVTDKNANLFNHGSLAASPSTAQSIDNNSSDGTVEGFTTNTGGGNAHGHAGSTADIAGAHDHQITTDSASALPPYYALAFIMKVV